MDGRLVHHRVPSMNQLGVLLLPLDGMLVHHRVPSMNQLGVLLLPLVGRLVHHTGANTVSLVFTAAASSVSEYFYLHLLGILVHRRVTPSIFVILSYGHQYPFIHLCRETIWSKVSCLRKQHNGRDQAIKLQTFRLEASTIITLDCRPSTGAGKPYPVSDHFTPKIRIFNRANWKHSDIPV